MDRPVIIAGQPFVLVVEPRQAPVTVIAGGRQGPPGPPGKNAPGSDGAPVISDDPDNQITQGTDGGLYVAPPAWDATQW
ncbi:hypothetical protein DN820_01735 [Stutzerimonas nosocomialis]|uniref:Uncharacterized protein n=1 Tax=Stutzerimonas nosocomialis TaxID=1056496 RepID=A0A5R9QIX6_9GAMM|nr:hypothetical protein [Stutzerimonas nosocomialis]TLX65060.1 hypothetical protein DN820_01735 [Stutzerimonas nosocomialis]